MVLLEGGGPSPLGFSQLLKDEKEQRIVLVVLEMMATRCDVVKAFHKDMPKSIEVVLMEYKGYLSHRSTTKTTASTYGIQVQDSTRGQDSTHS